ncbi:AAA family ATPase [Candidatus Woesearchaeota archaeon]|nr:AAA family ATPase [Candidatus Woesearchaeota archaeon]
MPKVIPYREPQQRQIAECLKPLMQDMNGKNLMMHGPSGNGKTVACKNLFQELQEETDGIEVLYINCWQKNTSFKIMSDMADQLGFKFTHNLKTDELFKLIKQKINKGSAVFCFDEADKIEDFDFLYMLLEEIYRKSIILITNYHQWLINLDPRIKSRLTPDTLEFRSYSMDEIDGILRERISYAFFENAWQEDAIKLIVQKAYEVSDIRAGLYLLKEAALIAESSSNKRIGIDHARKAIEKLVEFTIKNSADLEDETRFILAVVKKNPSLKMGELFKLYEKEGGKSVYKTFTRKIAKLAENKFVTLERAVGGSEGNTTIVNYLSTASKKEEKKLTDF